MITIRFMVRSQILCLAVILLALAYGTLVADDSHQVPPPKGDQCVEPTDIMRTKHFEFILDQRDKTVLHGIRTKQYQFTGCIDCHITPDENGIYARYSEPDKHFCANCHEYAAVKIDCFQCHSDRPEEAIRQERKASQSAKTQQHAPLSAIDYTVLTNARL